MENIQFAILQGDVEVNLGSILENVMAQQIRANGYHLHYFDSKKYGELDFVIQNGMKIDLLEIKSGNNYKSHPALNKVGAVDNWSFGKKYVFCKGNVEQEGDIVYLPWYMVMFYKHSQIEKNMTYQVDISNLN